MQYEQGYLYRQQLSGIFHSITDSQYHSTDDVSCYLDTHNTTFTIATLYIHSENVGQ